MQTGTTKPEVEYTEQDKKVIEVFGYLKARYSLREDVEVHAGKTADNKEISMYRIGAFLVQKSRHCNQCPEHERDNCRNFDLGEIFHVDRAGKGLDQSVLDEAQLEVSKSNMDRADGIDSDSLLIYVKQVATMDSWVKVLCMMVSIIVLEELKEYSCGESFTPENQDKINKAGTCVESKALN